MTSPHNTPYGLGLRPCYVVLTILVPGMLSCGESASGSGTSEARATGTSQATAVVELGEESYAFDRVTCDLNDSVDDDVLVRATGTAPDDRRMTLEVEQRMVGDRRRERVTLYFGSIMDGDQWNTYGTEQPAGNWVTENGGEALDGPLMVVADGGLTAEGRFTHETRDASQVGTVRVRCGA